MRCAGGTLLNADQMVAALYGDTATDAQATAAKKMYADLDPETKKKGNDAAKEIYGDGGHMSVDAWWETLDCRKMRVDAGDGNTADPTGPYCTHYPGSDFPPEKILSAEALAHVNKIGQAFLGRGRSGNLSANVLTRADILTLLRSCARSHRLGERQRLHLQQQRLSDRAGAEAQAEQYASGADGIHVDGDLAGGLSFLDQFAEQGFDLGPDFGHDAPDLVVVGRQLDRGPDDEATVAHRPREHAPERRRGRGCLVHDLPQRGVVALDVGAQRAHE